MTARGEAARTRTRRAMESTALSAWGRDADGRLTERGDAYGGGTVAGDAVHPAPAPRALMGFKARVIG